MDYEDLRRKYGPQRPHERSNHVLLYAIILAALAGFIGYLWVGLPLAPSPAAKALDEATCRVLLESYEPALADQGMEFTEVLSTRTFSFDVGTKEYRWRIHNEGPVLADIDFLSGLPVYQRRLYFVWDANRFVGCGLDYFFNRSSEQTVMDFQTQVECTGGGIEGAPESVKFNRGGVDGVHLSAFELLTLDGETTKSHVHVSFSNQNDDYNTFQNMLQLYGCG